MCSQPYKIEKKKTDLLIIGSEGAGCMAAIEAEHRNISMIMVTKGQWGKSGATVTGAADFAVDSKSLNETFGFKEANSNDSKDLFMQDTIKGGKYVNNQKLVRLLVDHAPERLRLLQEWGAKFSGRVIHASGHSYPRGVIFPGPNFVQVIKGRTRSIPNLSLLGNTLVLDLVVDKNVAKGAIALNMETGAFLFIQSKATILATGGAMSVYKHSTAPAELTGDGFAIAARAGATLVDMEFPMFFPGLFAWPPALRKIEVPYHLTSSGRIYGHMYNKRGERFMQKWDPGHLEHATRDILSVGIYNEILSGNVSKHGGVYVSIKHLPDDLIEAILEWDPAGSFKKYGFGKTYFDMKNYLPDMRRYSLEAVPACHFSNGGVEIDGTCRVKDIEGLFAAGEVTGGIHGGNRLSGTAFSDFLVFGKISGENAGKFAQETDWTTVPSSVVEKMFEPYFLLLRNRKGLSPFKAKEDLQNIAWGKLGIIRAQKTIQEAIKEVQGYRDRMKQELGISTKTLIMNRELLAALEAWNIAQNIEMIGTSAFQRVESRAAHYLAENPETDYTNWTKNIKLKMEDGKFVTTIEPIVECGVRPPTGIVPYGQTEAQ